MNAQTKTSKTVNNQPNTSKKAVYIVDGLRTPFLKARGKPGPFSASDLAVTAGRALLARQPFPPTAIDEVIVGCVMPSENEANIGRIVALRLGCGDNTPGWTVQRNCGSGMQALDSAVKDISSERADLVLVGGTEAMSHAPLMYNAKMVSWFAQMMRAKSFGEKAKSFFTLPLGAALNPIVALKCGLTDPLSGLDMGQTAENLAYQFNITREEMDAFALRSHQRVLAAQQDGRLQEEVTPAYAYDGKLFAKDDGARPDTTMQALAGLKPFFDRKFGLVTAGNSSQITDGAAMLILASEKAIAKYNLPWLAKIVDVNWGALNPDVMGLGPVLASTPLMLKHDLSFDDIDYWEINEAFAAQVLACEKAWQDDAFCQKYLGLNHAFGKLDENKLNVEGGAVALGHPVGASGARIVLHLAEELKRNNAKRGMAAICIGGGQGGAMLLETE